VIGATCKRIGRTWYARSADGLDVYTGPCFTDALQVIYRSNEKIRQKAKKQGDL
jgi:hypothetical protein